MKKATEMTLGSINKELTGIRKSWREGLIETYTTVRYQELLLAKKHLNKPNKDKELKEAFLRDRWLKEVNERRARASKGEDVVTLSKLNGLIDNGSKWGDI
ncbi:MAG: hypothetical protein ACRCZ0_08240 [Cetobacterium sp.]